MDDESQRLGILPLPIRKTQLTYDQIPVIVHCDGLIRTFEFHPPERRVMNPCNGMISPPAPKTPDNHGRYRHIHLGAYVIAHHVSYSIRPVSYTHLTLPTIYSV